MRADSGRKYPVKPMAISINMEETGRHIKQLIKDSCYTMKEIMEITGITAEQTIYKWVSRAVNSRTGNPDNPMQTA